MAHTGVFMVKPAPPRPLSAAAQDAQDGGHTRCRRWRERSAWAAARDAVTTALLRQDERDGDFARHTAGHPPLNVLTTLMRNPALFRLWAPLAEYLSNGGLPAKDREPAILRTAVRYGSPY